MNSNKLFTVALGIDSPWYVKDVTFDSENKRLDIKLDFQKGSVFEIEKEGKKIFCKAYDTVEKEWRHLNFFEHECYLKARVPRVRTEDGCVKQISPSWAGNLNGFTLLFEALILQLAKHMPVHQIGKLIHVSDHKIWAMLDKYVEKARERCDFSKINMLGVDETSISKGHKYITQVVDLEKKKTIFVTEGKGSKTIEKFKTDFELHGGDAKQITDISCDMSPAFIKGIKENLPNAKITFDKFHILKIINGAVDKVRRAEAKDNPLLKGSRYVLLKNECNLTSKQKEKMKQLVLSKLNLKSIRALHIRENFQQIYFAKTIIEFKRLLKKWYFWATHSRLDPIKKAANTIKKHWDGVINWKESQINNGILEGLNSVIQAAKRKARGYQYRHFKTIIYLITGDLDFARINSALPTQNS